MLSRSRSLRPALGPVRFLVCPKAVVSAEGTRSHQSLPRREVARRPRRFPSPSPGVPGAMGTVRQPASGCVPARRQRRAPGAQPAPGTGVRHYLALRLSFDWSDSAAPIPSLLRRATDTHSGRLLKGDDASFPCGGSALGSPRGIPDLLASASLHFPGARCLNPKLCACPLRSTLGSLG